MNLNVIVSRRMAQVEIIKTVNAVREAYGLPNPIIADALRAVLMDLTQEELLSMAVALAQPEKPEEAEKQEETPSGEHDSMETRTEEETPDDGTDQSGI